MKKIRKAIFPVAGLGTRFLPATKCLPKEMLAVVDKPLIQYAVEEARDSGIEEFIFVTGRNKSMMEDHFDTAFELETTLTRGHKTQALDALLSSRLEPGQAFYTRQQKASGLGHAIWCAHTFIQDEPVAVLLPDDFIISDKPCLKQMIEAHQTVGGCMAAVMEVPAAHVERYGILEVKADQGKLVAATGMVEKPQRDVAPSNLAIIGRYILEPEIFKHLEHQEPGAGGEVQLTDALGRMAAQDAFHGYRFDGRRYDCGDKTGMVIATLNAALDRKEMQDPILQELEAIRKKHEKRNGKS